VNKFTLAELDYKVETVFEEESSSLSSLMLENDVFFLCRMEKGKEVLLLLKWNDIWVLALRIARFHLVLSTREEILCRSPCFPIMSNLART